MKSILYAIFAIIAIGIATVMVLSAKIIGFVFGILLSILFVAVIIFLIFYALINKNRLNDTKEPERKERHYDDDYDPDTRVFR